jgi:hypothetical protein
MARSRRRASNASAGGPVFAGLAVGVGATVPFVGDTDGAGEQPAATTDPMRTRNRRRSIRGPDHVLGAAIGLMVAPGSGRPPILSEERHRVVSVRPIAGRRRRGLRTNVTDGRLAKGWLLMRAREVDRMIRARLDYANGILSQVTCSWPSDHDSDR